LLLWGWLEGSSHRFEVLTTSHFPEVVLVRAKQPEYRFARQRCQAQNEMSPFDSIAWSEW